MDAVADFDIQEIDKSRIEQADLENPGFGRIFSDHMLEVEYRDGAWQQPAIKPYGPVQVQPSLSTLHYAQSVFEGTKAYYAGDAAVHLFRPEQNYERMVRSCRRMCIPAVDRSVFLEGIRTLIRMDRKWIPRREGHALYIRPFACAWDPVIAARIADTYRFYVITSPVGSYYARPVKLVTSQQYVRAVQGGTGEAKTAGNYARSFYPARKANELGYDQVLWLDAFEHTYVEEVGTMNLFFVIDDTLITSPLTGTILPGITRDSVLQLARRWDMPVEERRITIDEVAQAGHEGRLQEVFGAGTAAVISPVECISHDGEDITPQETEGRGPVGKKLYDTIYGIQTGAVEDPFGWVTRVDL